jgi:hypothetical protein
MKTDLTGYDYRPGCPEIKITFFNDFAETSEDLTVDPGPKA